MITYWLIKHLDPDWKVAHKMWSMRVAAVWAIMSGLWVALPAFQDYVSPQHFAELCVAFSLAIMVGRLTNQPGLN